MLAVAEDKIPETIIIDSRSPDEYAGKPGSTLINKDRNEYVAFEGHIRTAVNMDYKTLLVKHDNPESSPAHGRFGAVLNKHKIDEKNISFVYGRNGHEDAVLFLALDAALNWPVKIYDGGWSQWGANGWKLTAKDGMLQEDSPWRTDIERCSESISYNKSSGFTLARETLQLLRKTG